MVQITLSVLNLLAAATFARAHWRNENRGIYLTGTHLNTALHKRDTWLQQEYLDAHNNERAAHGASLLTWDDGLSASAADWANQCKFEHSQSGQNLAAGTGNPTPATAVGWWNDERGDYDPGNPQYSHWTQVVWKSSSRLGCAMASCAPGTIFPDEYGVTSYFVCHYDPAGNVIGQFDQNVQE
ncbi:cysteine-rich Secretory family protein [Ceratobasidium sp. AG-Ba]|nr:cysteine-rich Secretory family protein [Ceratobasidium sp. AG-Ba]QRW04833.1 cysteine-rich Secretory family protein [Ceratobasidium sp. AG-Ba]